MLSSVPKAAFPLHVQTEPLGRPTALAGCLSPDPLSLGARVQEWMEQRCSRGWIRARLSLGDKEMHQASAVPELISPTQETGSVQYSILLRPCDLSASKPDGPIHVLQHSVVLLDLWESSSSWDSLQEFVSLVCLSVN